MWTYCLALTLLLHCAASEAVQGNCPDGWLSFSDNSCLLFNATEAMTWLEADKACKRSFTNGALLEILSVEELDTLVSILEFLEAQYDTKSWWTGGNDFGVESSWVWSRSKAAVEDFVWANRQPNGGIGANCMYLDSEVYYMAGDHPCEDIGYFPICQIHF